MTGCKSTCEPRLNWRFAALTPFAAVIGDVTTVALAFKGVIVIEEWLRCSLFHPGVRIISQSFVFVFFHGARVTIGSLQWFTNFSCFQSQPPSRLMLSSPNYRSSILKSSNLNRFQPTNRVSQGLVVMCAKRFPFNTSESFRSGRPKLNPTDCDRST